MNYLLQCIHIHTNFVMFLIIFLIASAYGRVAVDHDKHSIVSPNGLNENIKTIHIELPTIESNATNEVIETSNSITMVNDHKKKPIHVVETTVEHNDDICTYDRELSENTIDTSDDTEPCKVETKIDNGTALILTPFIEEGRIEEARNACKVDSEIFLGITSYSGFLTVNKTYNSNIFFWYFPVDKKPVNETPWLIWLQGGPGASSMTGLFDEIGPFSVVNDFNGKTYLRRNSYTWLRNHSLLFIENPVGTGFSFTDHVNGYTKDMATYGKHLYSTLEQFLQIFPELKQAPLYIAGESYAGKYVPALGIEIHKHKESSARDINFQGLIIGNAYVDPAMISQLVRPFYYFGLLQSEQIEIVKPLLDSFNQDIAANRSIEAKNKWNSLVTILLFLTHQKHAYNFLRDELLVGKYANFLSRADVKKAIHVGDIKFSFVNLTVNSQLAPDFLSSATPLFETLLDHYKVLAYCGQLDQMLPCVFTSENYRTWNWNGSQEFQNATRYPYIFNNRLAGYHKAGGRLTEVVIRGAGHMVPVDAPAPIQGLVSRWTHDKPLSVRFSMLEGSFVQEYVRNNSIVHYL